MKNLLFLILLLSSFSLFAGTERYPTIAGKNIVLITNWSGDGIKSLEVPSGVFYNINTPPSIYLRYTLSHLPPNSKVAFILSSTVIGFELFESYYLISYNSKGSIISYIGEDIPEGIIKEYESRLQTLSEK